MHALRTTAALALILAAALFAGCAETSPSPVAVEPTSAPVVEETVAIRSVEFRSGSVPESSTVVTAVVDQDELVLLDSFPQLKTADLSGSTCYPEILAYADSHPDIRVIYTVTVGGALVPPSAESAVAMGAADADSIIDACRYLPNLTALDVRACGLDIPGIQKLVSALPDITFGYTVGYGGASYDSDLTELDLSGYSAAEVLGMTDLLDLLPNLAYVNLMNKDKSAGGVACNISLEQLSTLQQRYPNVGFDYPFTLFDRRFSTADTLMDLKGVNIGKTRVDEVRKWLSYMTVCDMVDMDGCNVPNEMMAELRDEFPDANVVWRVRFTRYSCRTDATVLRASTANPKATTEQLSVIKYCTKLEMLDLGHNDIRNIDFVAYMPNLRVAILAIGYVKDISALANCPHLEYLELFTNFITDITPLAELKELKHLNIAYNRIEDISPLFGLTQLERLFLSRNYYPQSQLDTLIASLPDTEIDYTTHNPTGGTWRVQPDGSKSPRYALLCEQFHYDMLADFVFE